MSTFFRTTHGALCSPCPSGKRIDQFNHGGHGATLRRGTEGCRNKAVPSVSPYGEKMLKGLKELNRLKTARSQDLIHLCLFYDADGI
jgi:hypothetical protein